MWGNSITERWIGSCRRELLDRTLIWNLRHLMMVLREYEDFYNSDRPHRALDQAAPLRPLPDGITDLDHFRVRRHDRVGGVIHEYELLSRPVDQDLLGGFGLGILAGSFDEFAVGEGGSGADQGDEMRCVDGAPVILG